MRGIVTSQQARQMLGESRYLTLMSLGFHYLTESGEAYWSDEEWDDLIGLIELELRLDVKHERPPGGESREPFASDSGQRGCNLLACDRHQLELDTDVQS